MIFQLNYRQLAFMVLMMLSSAWATAGPLDTGFLAPSAATQGLGGAHSALGGDPEDFMINPATLARQKSVSLDLQSGYLFDGSTWLLGGTAVVPVQEDLVVALSNQRLWADQSQNYEQFWMGSVGIPLREGGESALGITLQYVESSCGDPGHGLGVDMGLLHRIAFGEMNLALAASIIDVDTTLTRASGIEERIPQVIKLGFGLEWKKDFRFGLDNDFINSGEDTQYVLHMGAEKSFWQNHLMARFGYVNIARFNSADSFGGSADRFTFGLGLRYDRFHFDYAFLPSSGGVGVTHRLGIQFDFGRNDQPRAVLVEPLPFQPLKIEKSLRGDKMVWLIWEDPQGNENTSYDILTSDRPDAFFNRLAQTGGGQRAFELRGLENGRAYYFKISSLDAKGHEIDSTLSAVVKLVPEAPQAAVAAALDNTRVALDNGQMDKALEWAFQARLAEPDRADTELLIQRLKKINSGGKQ